MDLKKKQRTSSMNLVFRLQLIGDNILEHHWVAPPLWTPLSKNQVDDWLREIQQHANIARTHPQATYCAFVHGIRGRWLYILRTIPKIEHPLAPLEDAMPTAFIPALTGLDAPGDLERDLFAMPVRYGGLGLVNPISIAEIEHQHQ